ncbi:MAG: hypothetical protein FJX72_20970 [Armatimonadetes bacterium]|nr:hypothetical protein [Armatimonadota bacterium]
MGRYTGRQANLADPAEHAFAVTPNDSTDLTDWALALYVGVSGNVKVTTWAGETVTFANAPVGVLPVRVRRVFATGTTASSILGLY